MHRGNLLLTGSEDGSLTRVLTALQNAGFQVTHEPEPRDALAALADVDAVLLIADLSDADHMQFSGEVARSVPGLPVILATSAPRAEQVVDAIRMGAADVVQRPLDADLLAITLDRAISAARMRRELRAIRRSERGVDTQLVGNSPPMRRVRELVTRMGPLPSSVLILGETGTGKEVVARELHRHSNRANKPFIALNCAAVPEALLESELFGHTRGAFTDAREARQGLFVKADGGTLFLDEIGDMPLPLQAKLLRALQENVVRPVGSAEDVPFDARILAATHRNLDDAVDAGTFRSDLLYRLDVLRIELPPLRERGSDVLVLAHHAIAQIATRLGRPTRALSPAAAHCLLDHPWKGNVRELHNALERAVALAEDEFIEPSDLPLRVGRSQPAASATPSSAPSLQPLVSLAEVERAHIARVMRHTNGNKVRAAIILGIDRKTLHRHLTKMDRGETPQLG